MRRRRAVIQMASSLRNIGRVAESVELLTAEAHNHDPDAAVLADAVSAVLALCLADLGREREAVSVALLALAPHLPRYQRSMANYARLLAEPAQSNPSRAPASDVARIAVAATLSSTAGNTDHDAAPARDMAN